MIQLESHSVLCLHIRQFQRTLNLYLFYRESLGPGIISRQIIGHLNAKNDKRKMKPRNVLAIINRLFTTKWAVHHEYFFSKPPNRKWTWISADGKTKTIIEKMIENVEALNRYSIGSDHWIMRAKIVLDIKQERYKLMDCKKCSGEDGMVVESLKLAGRPVIEDLTVLFNLCIDNCHLRSNSCWKCPKCFLMR